MDLPDHLRDEHAVLDGARADVDVGPLDVVEPQPPRPVRTRRRQPREAMSGRRARPAARTASGSIARGLKPRSAQRLPDRALHRVVLVVAGDLLDGRARAVVLEHGEVADQVQQAPRRAQVLDHGLEFGGAALVSRSPAIGVPRLEPLLARGEAADARADAVGDDQQGVGVEERGDLRLVGLELLVGLPDVGGARWRRS